MSNIPNWHRYAIVALGIVGAILAGVAADPGILPPPLQPGLAYVPLALLVEGAILAGMPRFQLPTGPGAPPIVSPPPSPPHG